MEKLFFRNIKGGRIHRRYNQFSKITTDDVYKVMTRTWRCHSTIHDFSEKLFENRFCKTQALTTVDFSNITCCLLSMLMKRILRKKIIIFQTTIQIYAIPETDIFKK